MDCKNKHKISIKAPLIFVTLIILYACFLLFSFQHMKKSLYKERASNTKMLMEKINENVEIGIKNRWTNVHHFANMLEREELKTLEDAKNKISNMLEDRPEEISRLFLIDVDGICYTADKQMFKWSNKELLNSGVDEFYISSSELRVTEEDVPQMFFLTPLRQSIILDDVELTHLGFSCKMSFMDSYFDTEEYGEESVAFVICKSGRQIYRQEKDNSISNVYNVLSALSRAKYNYGASYEQLEKDIEAGINGCISIEYQGELYYLAYKGLSTKDWCSVIMIPEEKIGTGTEGFMQSIIMSTMLMVLGGMGIIMIVIWVNARRINKQKEQVNIQLIKAAEAERSANKAKTQFLSAMSHDIRTPMNAIIGMTTLAKKHLEDPQYMKNCLEKVTLASNHLLTLINDVLDISKVESGKMTLNPVVFSLTETVSNMVNMIRQQIDVKGQKFNVRVYHIEQEYLFADELRLNQIFINILSNAVKYTPEGGTITVDLRQEPVEENPNIVRIIYSVEDTGVGMSEEFQENMYSSVVRAEENHGSNIQGTGLGLAICKQMVRLMKGTIECESRLGEGTRFTITVELPIAGKIEERMDEEDIQADFEGLHLLVAEDNEINWEIAKELLSMYGITTVRAENGRKCVDIINAAKDGEYDMILMDIQMPCMDGYEAASAIRGSDREYVKNIPIIAMTADAFAEDIQKCVEAGMNSHIAKPINVNNLITIIERWVKFHEI